MVDVTTWRAYAAEHSLRPQRAFRTFNAARDFALQVTSSSLWRNLVDHPHTLEVVRAPYRAHQSWFERDRRFRFTRASLAIHPKMRHPLNLLHELAHGAAPNYRYVTGRSDSLVPSHAGLHPHGSLWASTFVQLAAEFAADQRQALVDAYTHYGVPIVDDDQLAAAVAESRRAEHEIEAWDDALAADARPLLRSILDNVRDPAEPFVTSADLSEALTRLMIQTTGWKAGDPYDDAVIPTAAALDRVLACSAADLNEVLEHRTVQDLRAHAEDGRLEQVALAAAIHHGLDPIWLRTDIGLTRWDAGLTHDQVHQLNPDWAALVHHLDQLYRARPSRWTPQTLGERHSPFAHHPAA